MCAVACVARTGDCPFASETECALGKKVVRATVGKDSPCLADVNQGVRERLLELGHCLDLFNYSLALFNNAYILLEHLVAQLVMVLLKLICEVL